MIKLYGIKSYWEKEYGSPPYGHAEESSLSSFSQRMGIDIEQAMILLKEKNIRVDAASQTLLEISRTNGISPKAIYETIKPKRSTANAKISSLGRRTLEELSNINKINLEKSLKYLKQKGFHASPQTKMKEAANALDMTPYGLFDKLKVLQ